MCNPWCLSFAKQSLLHVATIPGMSVLEVGAKDVNGTARSLFSAGSVNYTGVDIEAGPGVDEILDVAQLTGRFGADAFDLVISTEMIEHCRDWQEAIVQMGSVLKKDGLLVITTRSPGFAIHGYPQDFWRFTADDMRAVFENFGVIEELGKDFSYGWAAGVGVAVRKRVESRALRSWARRVLQLRVAAVKAEEKPGEAPLNFDQDGRYRLCAELIAGMPNVKSVLDIGSGETCPLNRFITGRIIHGLDPGIRSAGPSRFSENLLTGHVEDTYDVVVSMDTLEHIPPGERGPFVDRLEDAARQAVVLGFPFSESPGPAFLDRVVQDLYEGLFHTPHHWLEEHIRLGLPSFRKIAAQLRRRGWHVRLIPQGYLPWYEELLPFTICASRMPEWKGFVAGINDDYNELLSRYDRKQPSYRMFIVASRSPLPDALIGSLTRPGGGQADHVFTRMRRRIQDAMLRRIRNQKVDLDRERSDHQKTKRELAGEKSRSDYVAQIIEQVCRLGDVEKPAQDVILFGSGEFAAIVFRYLPKRMYRVRGIFDNHGEPGRKMSGFPVRKPALIPGCSVIVASRWQREIRRQLLDLGYQPRQVITFRFSGKKRSSKSGNE